MSKPVTKERLVKALHHIQEVRHQRVKAEEEIVSTLVQRGRNP